MIEEATLDNVSVSDKRNENIDDNKSKISSRSKKRMRVDKSAASRPKKRMKVDKSVVPTKLTQKPPRSDENMKISCSNKWKSNIHKDDDGMVLNSAGHKTCRIPIINILPTDNITLITDSEICHANEVVDNITVQTEHELF